MAVMRKQAKIAKNEHEEHDCFRRSILYIDHGHFGQLS